MRGLAVEQMAYSAAHEAEAILFAQALEEDLLRSRVMVASELEGFAESEARCRKLLGFAALHSTVESPAISQPTMTIFEAVLAAAKGDKQAEAMVDINIGTAVTEACFKYDHVTSVAMRLDEQGHLIQFGQKMSDIQYNAFAYRQHRHQRLQNATRIEALNSHCIEDLARQGSLKDHWFIVSSLVPQGVPEKALQQEGYFLNTLTFINQCTTESGNKIVTDSGFCRGTAVDAKATFAERIGRRHDIETISRVRQRLGLLPISTTEEALEGILVPKQLLPHGVIDFMRMCDEEADALLARPRQQNATYYEQLTAESLKREQSLEGTKQMVKEALLAQAPILTTPNQVVQRIWDLTKEFTVIAAVDNKYIDERIFGEEAEERIINTRYLLDIGDVVGAQLELREAVRAAIIVGCGGGSAAEKGLSKSSNKNTNTTEDDEYNTTVDHNEKWKWKSGICRVDACPTRPGKTQVGPCSVCRRCQKMFDKGIDPTKFIVPNRKTEVSFTPATNKEALAIKPIAVKQKEAAKPALSLAA